MLGNSALAQLGIAQFPPGVFGSSIVNLSTLTLPINCVMAGNQPLKVDRTEIDARPANFKLTTKINADGLRKLSGESGFTVTTSKRGYD